MPHTRLYVERSVVTGDRCEVTCTYCNTPQLVHRVSIRVIRQVRCEHCGERFWASYRSAALPIDVRLLCTTERRWTHRLREWGKAIYRRVKYRDVIGTGPHDQ